MGAKTGTVISLNWYMLVTELSAYRRWNVGKGKRGTEETLPYPAIPSR